MPKTRGNLSNMAEQLTFTYSQITQSLNSEYLKGAINEEEEEECFIKLVMHKLTGAKTTINRKTKANSTTMIKPKVGNIWSMNL